LVVIDRTEQDLEDLRAMAKGFKAQGARVVMFDDVHDPDSSDPKMRDRESALAGDAGIEVVRVSPILAASPDRKRFMCLDHIHMTEPYHRLMAKEWLNVVVSDRRAN
jgi:hypothetical protein